MTNHIDRHVGARMRKLRQHMRPSTRDAGQAARISTAELVAYESAVLRMPAEVMLELCQALCVTPEELFVGLDLPPPQPAVMPPQLEKVLRDHAVGRR